MELINLEVMSHKGMPGYHSFLAWREVLPARTSELNQPAGSTRHGRGPGYLGSGGSVYRLLGGRAIGPPKMTVEFVWRGEWPEDYAPLEADLEDLDRQEEEVLPASLRRVKLVVHRRP